MYITLHVRRFFCMLLIAAAACFTIFLFGQNPTVLKASIPVHKGIPLPAIMYHSMLEKNPKNNQYIVSPKQFEEDLKYLKEHGYTGIFMQDLLDYVNKGTPLPEKPILLTFDDGYYNNYLYAYPLAQKYQTKIIISPIGSAVDYYSEKEANHAAYSHITWDQINEMKASGLVEFQNHTYKLHENTGKRLGTRKLESESKEVYAQVLTADISKMQNEMQEHTGFEPTTFVYPFGAVSYASVPVIKDLGFSASLTCEKKMNYITQKPDCLYGIGRYLRPPGKKSEAFFSHILP